MQLSRSLMITYLDEDLCVLRDATGNAEVLEKKSLATQYTSPQISESEDFDSFDQPSDLE